MYKLSKDKLSFTMTEDILFRGSTSLYWKNEAGTLSCYTICPHKGQYLLDKKVIEDYNTESVGLSHWRGYRRFQSTWVSYSLPIYRIDNIPLLKPIHPRKMKKYLEFLWIEGLKLSQNRVGNIWEYMYAKYPLKTFQKTAEWVLDYGLSHSLKVDHNPYNFLWFNSHWFWYDPFFNEQIINAITLRKYSNR